MEKSLDFARRVLVYCLGLVLMALGVSLSISSDLGVSPVSVIPYVVSVLFHLDLGLSTTCVLSLFVLSQFVIHRKGFRATDLLQVLAASLFGGFLSITNACMGDISVAGNYPLQLLFCGMGIVLVAMGILLYMGVDVMPLPAEGVMKAISHRFERSLSTSKIFFDCTAVVLSLVLSLSYAGAIVGVREGTVICALGVGFCIKVILWLRRRLRFVL